METKDGTQTFYASTRKPWRTWLEKNGQSATAVWLIIYHKKSETASIAYPEAVEEALCFGWIDCKAKKRDEESFYLFFTLRKPKSNWSKVNKERVGRLIAQGMMTQHGQKLIDVAIETGRWEING